jgi:hypothetical protein
MVGKRRKGTDREEETERRDGGEIHRRRNGGKETEGNRQRERDRGEQT